MKCEGLASGIKVVRTKNSLFSVSRYEHDGSFLRLFWTTSQPITSYSIWFETEILNELFNVSKYYVIIVMLCLIRIYYHQITDIGILFKKTNSVLWRF